MSPTLQFRKDISPHLGKPDFDRLVRSFDYNSGFSKPITTTSSLTPMTIADRLADADVKLRRARNIYAYLAVYAPGDRFHAETAVQYPAYHADLCKAPDDVVADTVDWCDFAGRMRQSVREVAYLHMIFGQQFTTDALGLHFSADLIGGEEFVRDEVRKLDSAVTEFGSAEKVVIEGLNIPLGSGCSVSDFYSQSEWALLSRAVEGKEVAQHQVAIRKSYLDDNGPTVAQNTYQTAAGDQYVKLIGTAGLTVTQPRFSGCARGTRPDSDMVAIARGAQRFRF